MLYLNISVYLVEFISMYAPRIFALQVINTMLNFIHFTGNWIENSFKYNLRRLSRDLILRDAYMFSN